MSDYQDLLEWLRELSARFGTSAVGNATGQAADAIAALVKERDEAQSVRDRVILEAQCHAQEARTANNTIYQIYRACTNGTGEPGNWHGAQPVIDELAARELRGERRGLEKAAIEANKWGSAGAAARAIRALIIAEIERLDRAQAQKPAEETRSEDDK